MRLKPLQLLSGLARSFLAATIAISAGAVAAHADCQLNSASNKIKHVVYVEFDNVHFTRDNPNVPSDLEQMPNLLNFLTQNGTLDAGNKAVLISHTANDILTTQTGVYPDRHGMAVSNSFGVFGPIDAMLAPNGVWFPSSFFYWTDLVQDITPQTNDAFFAMLTEDQKNMPAPWAPFAKAGCDVGAFSTANIVLERSPFDVIKVFGTTFGETSAQQNADFIGEAIHCAKGSPLCGSPNGANVVDDLLPDEPGGYSGFQALFGAKNIAPVLGGPLTDLDGNVLKSGALVGFPSFSPTATQTLGAVSTMLEHGIPIVFAYISDVHDNHGVVAAPPFTFGPGEAAYVQQAKSYDKAFGQFFTRLAADGIDKPNTLFVFVPDEGDHFVGGPASPAGCDGVNTPCTYSKIGELTMNLGNAVVAAGNSTPFDVHSDDAPTVYVKGQPMRTDADTRALERVIGGLTATSPITGNVDQLTVALADPVEEQMLHMVTSDPARTPTFTMFGDADYFFSSGAGGSATPVENPGFAWNHGDIQPEIARTFFGIVGPGVQHLGVTNAFFSDHTDLRPTIMSLVGINDSYVHDGRVMIETIDPSAMPQALHAHHETLLRLGQAYKQINAPFGALAMSTLAVSTAALKSGSPMDDSTYTQLEGDIEGWTAQRGLIAGQMKAMLEGAEFNSQQINEHDAKSLIDQAQTLIDQAATVAATL